MKTRIKVFGSTLIVGLLLSLLTRDLNPQAPVKKIPPEPSAAVDPTHKLLQGKEELAIRLAYRKLEVYNLVGRFVKSDGLSAKGGPGNDLSIELSDFRTGYIEELSKTPYDEVSSPPSGEMIQLIPASFKNNESEERRAYLARWIPGQYSMMADRNWTVGDVLRVEAAKYYDVTGYTRYKARVVFEGKTRTYNAVVLHRATRGDLKLEFWDSIVGLGGTVTRIWEELALPVGVDLPKRERSESRLEVRIERALASTRLEPSLDRAITCDGVPARPQQCRISQDLRDFWGMDKEGYWKEDFLPDAISDTISEPDDQDSRDYTWFPSDETGHHPNTGAHWAYAQFRSECVSLSGTTQRCLVSVLVPQLGDTERSHTDFRYHVGILSSETRSQDGPRGREIQCDAAVGAAFSRCYFRDCTFPMELAIIGVGTSAQAQVSGGDLWRSGHAHGNICALPRTTSTPGGCNEPAEFGCMSGFVAVNGVCTRSDAFMSQCFRFGDYDFETCACTGGCEGSCSPIVIDVLGNGFSFTDAATGVFFDMEGRGTVERFSWTSAGSDDAWLALDRNNNGLIDSGKELFGNITPQDLHPEGVERNGFLALALYDSPAYGGNGDGFITRDDSIFNRLRLWRDENHNGVSEDCELVTLSDAGLVKIDLDYRSSRRVDEHGNQFKYRSKVRDSRGSDIGRWAWDVFLVKQP